MVAQRRFGPLIVTVFVGLFVVLARLFQVQIVEHEVWAQQAAGLVRSEKVLPAHRGEIVDRNERVLVHDEPVYQIELRYRDFRRGHPLGILAHARSAIEMRAVPLAEALAHRAEWSADLLRVSQGDLDRFAQGHAWSCGSVEMPAAAEKDRALCGKRALDVRYYAAQLLGLEKREADGLRKLVEPERSISFLELIATRHGLAPDALLARVQTEVDDACSELARLSETLPFDNDSAATGPSATVPAVKGGPELKAASEHTGTSFERLIATLEAVRTGLEDDAADELFRIAAGFEAGEVATATLQNAFDLDWIQNVLRWDRPRLDVWAQGRRTQRESRIERGLLPRMIVQVELEDAEHAPERLLDELAQLWSADPERDSEGRPRSWRTLDDLVVLADLDTLFAGARLPRGVDVPELVVPFQDEELRATPADAEQPWRIVGMLSDLAGKDDSGAVEPLREPAASEFWAESADSKTGLETPEVRAELLRLVQALDRRHAAAVDRLFASLAARQGDALPGDGRSTRLQFGEDRLRRALNQEKYILIDCGNRPLRLFGEPPYELVQRIARHPELFAGFEVCETMRRVQLVKDKGGEPCAGLLVGDVRKPQLREMLQQTAEERRLDELRYQTSRNEDEEREAGELAVRVQRSDEWTGGYGLEEYLDPELRARPGWLETKGLEENARAGGEARAQAPHDGQRVVLTIDTDLQLAAQDLLAAPRVPTDPGTDRLWFENPVGAIVLITPDGDVLAAASAPEKRNETAVPGRDKEREYRRERTLQMPTFQPPGSVFKPFVAAYALGKNGFDPSTQFECADAGNNRGAFESMHCLHVHRFSDLRRALTVSCNSFFAQLGTTLSTDASIEMMAMFGFGEPTGIKCMGSKGRSGLIEHLHPADAAFRRRLADRRAHLQFANGLSVIEATPMQVARAMAGIVTGRLPDIRLIEKIGENEVRQASRPLGIDDKSLEYVRSALRDVVADSEGTAKSEELRKGTLGFQFACKTGSADYLKFQVTAATSADELGRIERGKMRKHTWIAGYFPAEAPRAILVVYLHDTAETSTHTAVYLAAEYLQTPAVKAFVAKALYEVPR